MDLAAYAQRIGYRGELRPTAECLHNLHFAHVTHIPFENLDVLLHRPIRLDVESLFQKLVVGGRGGYCFEQNGLFAAVLEAIGFQVTRLAARVMLGAAGVGARTHMLLLVGAEGERWLADVGFGGESLLYPLPWEVNQPVPQFGWQYRIREGHESYVLESLRPEGWYGLYNFTLEAQHAVDNEVANHYTSTHPKSLFVSRLMVHTPSARARWTLLNRCLTERRPEGVTESRLADDAAVLAVLAERFGLHFRPGTRFGYQDEGLL